jgi:hypothetical protein
MRLTREQQIKLRKLRKSQVYKDYIAEHDAQMSVYRKAFPMCYDPIDIKEPSDE